MYIKLYFINLIYFHFLVFGAKLSEFDYIMKKQNVVQHDTFVKLRGLPYTVIRDDIEKFFEGKQTYYFYFFFIKSQFH